MMAGSNDCKLGVVFSPQWELRVTLLSALHHTSIQQGEGCALHSFRPLSSVPTPYLPSSVDHSKRVLWAVSKVHPWVLAAGEGECFMVREIKAVWEVCIFVCQYAGPSHLLLGEVDPVFKSRHPLQQLSVIEVHVVGKVSTNR